MEEGKEGRDTSFLSKSHCTASETKTIRERIG
jgi:hypothetical protein